MAEKYFKQNEYGVKYPCLVGVDNFRDLGGIQLDGGRRLKDGVIFRSGALYGLTEEEKNGLDKLQIGHIFDFRGYDEVEYKPDYVPEGAVYHNIPAAATRGSLVVKQDKIAKMIKPFVSASFAKWLFKLRFKHLYRKFPFNNKAYVKMFEIMDVGDSFLFHCSAGKDRTGVASMLILLALGADIETIKNDYMLSNFYRIEANVKFDKQFEHYKNYKKLHKIFKTAGNVDLKYFDCAYKKIIRKYKTVKRFLLKEYGIDDCRINRWLQTYAY